MLKRWSKVNLCFQKPEIRLQLYKCIHQARESGCNSRTGNFFRMINEVLEETTSRVRGNSVMVPVAYLLLHHYWQRQQEHLEGQFPQLDVQEGCQHWQEQQLLHEVSGIFHGLVGHFQEDGESVGVPSWP